MTLLDFYQAISRSLEESYGIWKGSTGFALLKYESSNKEQTGRKSVSTSIPIKAGFRDYTSSAEERGKIWDHIFRIEWKIE